MRHTALILMLLAGCAVELSGDDESVNSAVDTHNPDNCPGGSGGPEGGPGRGKPIPAPKDCTKEPTPEQCYLCCDWNEKNVWGETCRRIKNKEDRRACWWRLENTLRPQCQRGCGPITTVAP